MAHFGKAAQPYSTEAYNWSISSTALSSFFLFWRNSCCFRLKKEILHRKLHVQLYSKDRFGRIVSMVYYKKFPYLKKLNLSEEMLRNGFATTYTQKGAVHAGLLEKFMKIEAKAQFVSFPLLSTDWILSRKDRKGMWQQAAKNYESPADYKQRIGKSWNYILFPQSFMIYLVPEWPGATNSSLWRSRHEVRVNSRELRGVIENASEFLDRVILFAMILISTPTL